MSARPSAVPSGEVVPQLVAVVAFVSDHALAVRRGDRFGDLKVRSWSCIDSQLQCSPTTIHQGGELGIEPSLGATNGLQTLASGGVGGVLVQLDIRGVQMPELTFGGRSQPIENRLPKPAVIPPTPPGVNALPGTEDLGQIAPGAADAHSVDHRLHHAPMAPRRSTTRRYRYRSRMAFLNFF